MANFTVTQSGAINNAGDSKALFLKQFSGEVLAAFNNANVMMSPDKHIIRTISSGKSAQFPMIGRTSAAYMTPGEQLLGTAINHAERVITIDDLLVANTFIFNLDEAMNHYDVRGEYSTQLGEALALHADERVLRMGYLAARSTSPVTGEPGGTELVDLAMDSDINVFVANVFAAAAALDGKNIPSENRTLYVSPTKYYELLDHPKTIHKDFGGEGSYAKGVIAMIAGIAVQKTNNLPSTNITTGLSKYQGDFSTSVALIMHPSAVGTVKLLDLSIESDYMVDRQGTLMGCVNTLWVTASCVQQVRLN